MLQRPDFDSKDIDPDLHKRMAKAVDDGRIKCFDLREGPADGDQDLNLWIRELEDVVREIMEDPIFKGNRHFHFEMDLDELGRMCSCAFFASMLGLDISRHMRHSSRKLTCILDLHL